MANKMSWHQSGARPLRSLGWGALFLLGIAGCKGTGTDDHASAAAASAKASRLAPQVPDDALPAEQTGGFDGALAYEHVAKLVGLGPRPVGSSGIAQAQDYITSQLS